jgi:hypothetical protein
MAERRVWATPADLADWLQLDGDGERKLRQWRQRGTGPKFIKQGRDVRYAWADVHAWCAEQRTPQNGVSR